MRSKMDMLDDIRLMLTDMEPLLEIMGCKLTLPPDADKLKADHIREGYKWLMSLHNLEYRDARRARRCVTEEMWRQYGLLGIEDLQEMVLWTNTSATLKKAIRSNKRPSIFMKTVKKEMYVKHTHQRST